MNEQNCECLVDDDEKNDFYIIVYCPLHKAAPALVEALRRSTKVLQWYHEHHGNLGGALWQAEKNQQALALAGKGEG